MGFLAGPRCPCPLRVDTPTLPRVSSWCTQLGPVRGTQALLVGRLSLVALRGTHENLLLTL